MSEQSIFLSALEIADPAEREAFLNDACGSDARLRTEIEALLQSHAAAGDFLKTPALEQVAAPALPTVMLVESTDDQHDAAADDPLADLRVLLQASSAAGSLGRLGHYEVHEVLGRGAFGIVVRAFDDKLHRMVAIKLMNPELAATSPPRKRFLREARSAAAVKHENIVSIYAVEEQPIPYLVMEYVPGMTLQQWLDQHGPLDVSEVLRIGQQIAHGLSAAHAQGLIHRDIKPANILLENGIESKVKISDFGLARAADDASLTQSGLIAGTPMYMAPEQARGESLDARADLFSLGSVLYVMTSGRPPFRAPSTLAVLKRVCEDTPRSIGEIMPGTPDWLSAIIARLHAKDPADRFQTAKEVADLLGEHLAHLREPSTVPTPKLVTIPRPLSLGDRSALDQLRGPGRGLIATAIVNWVTLVVLLLFGVYVLAQRQPTVFTLALALVIVVPVLSLATAVILAGGLKLQRAESYWFCVFASVAAMLIGPGYFLGWPVGIWSLIVLSRPEVREAFRRREHRTVERRVPATGARRTTWLTAAAAIVLLAVGLWLGPWLPLWLRGESVIELNLEDRNARLVLSHSGEQFGAQFGERYGDQIMPVLPGLYELHLIPETGREIETAWLLRQTPLGTLQQRNLAFPMRLRIGRGERLKLSATFRDLLPRVNTSEADDPPWVDLAALQRLVELARQDRDRARRRHELGELSLPDLLAAEIRVADAERQIAEARRDWMQADRHYAAMVAHHRGWQDIVQRQVEAGVASLEDANRVERHAVEVQQRWNTFRAAHRSLFSPRGDDPQFREFASGEWIDVISLIDPLQDRWVIPGNTGESAWTIENGELVSDGDQQASKLLFPLDSDWLAYECELEFTRRTGSNGFNLNLPANINDCPLSFDMQRPGDVLLGRGRTGIQLGEGHKIVSGERTKVRVEVRRPDGRDHVAIWFNDHPLVPWIGWLPVISGELQERYPQLRRLSLWIQPGGNEFVFHHIRVRLLDGGTATAVRPVAPATLEDNTPPLAVAPFDADQARAHQESWANHLGVPVEFTDTYGLNYRLIPPGEFLMGSTADEIRDLSRALEQAKAGEFEKFVARFSGPQHRVRITQPFYCSAYEVTAGQYRQFIEETKYIGTIEQLGVKRFRWSDFAPAPDGDRRAVIGVSWEDANAFCQWLSRKTGLTVELPTEAQWEYACRAGTNTLWSFGNDPSLLNEYAVFGREPSQPVEIVGSRKPNPFGLFDLHGNAEEWCRDWHDSKFYAQSPVDDPVMVQNPSEVNSGRVLRGGGSHAAAWWTRSTTRPWDFPSTPANAKGFRVVITGDLHTAAGQRRPEPAAATDDAPILDEAPVSAASPENAGQ
jgi:serine/threonine protein kinase/formylglycine-generating enzyme required for sulfatase activity